MHHKPRLPSWPLLAAGSGAVRVLRIILLTRNINTYCTLALHSAPLVAEKWSTTAQYPYGYCTVGLPYGSAVIIPARELVLYCKQLGLTSSF
jgi:hypothetical protein